MLSNILKQRKCFKLVCGAGNEDAIEVEKLVALYAAAGACYFDLSAREDVVQAAWCGLRRIAGDNLDRYFLNVSVGIKGDPHVSKAMIDATLCTSCGACEEVCLQKAIVCNDNNYEVTTKRCIGCGACISSCPVAAITTYSRNQPLEEVLPPLISLGIHAIEFHAVSDDEEGIEEQWRIISSLFKGMLSLCIDRSHLGDAQLIKLVRRLITGRADFSTIIQADGAPMSGCDDRYETTLQALGTAQIIQRANLPVFLMLSGGTNSKTTELAKLFNIPANGVALGSFARMIVRKQIDRDDFLSNEVLFGEALVIARNLVETSLKYMG
jgi:ferredoxin